MVRIATCGMLVVDTVGVDFPDEPRSGKTQFTKASIQDHAGGHPINVGIDLVRLGVVPSEVGVIGCVAEDSSGALIEAELAKYGLGNFLKKVQGEVQGEEISTGRDLIIVPQGRDRSFNISPGANLELTAEHVIQVLDEKKPKLLSIRPGYSGIDLELAEILKNRKDTFVLLDLMKPYEKEWSFIMPAVKYATAVHCNDMEAMNITGKKSIVDAAKAFLNKGVQIVFITLGENGAILFTRDREIKQPAFDVGVVDPTGCGDAFCAGIIKKLIDWDAFPFTGLAPEQLEELLGYAQAAGAACATGIGTTAGVSQEKVQEILQKGKSNE